MKDGQRAARFEEIVMPHLDAAYNLARWLAGNAHDADDLAQESMLRALRFFEGFRGGDARTWLLTIVRNTYYSDWRRARRRGDSTEFDEDAHSMAGDDGLANVVNLDPERIASRRQDVRLLDRALSQVPEEYREALVLREVEDLSYRQIAETLSVPMGTVMSRISRARHALQVTFDRLAGGREEYPPRRKRP